MITEIDLITFFGRRTLLRHKLEALLPAAYKGSPASYFRKRRTDLLDVWVYASNRPASTVTAEDLATLESFYTALEAQSARSVIEPPKQLPEGLLAEATRDACDEHRAPPPRALLKHVAYRVEGTLKLEFPAPRGELPRWDDDSENYWFLDASDPFCEFFDGLRSRDFAMRMAISLEDVFDDMHLHDICEMIAMAVDHVLDNDEDLMKSLLEESVGKGWFGKRREYSAILLHWPDAFAGPLRCELVRAAEVLASRICLIRAEVRDMAPERRDFHASGERHVE
jgi:hypothetical protein